MVCKAIRQNYHQFFQNRESSNLQNNLSYELPVLKILHTTQYLVIYSTFVLIDFSRNCLFTDRTIFATSCFNRYLGLHNVAIIERINKFRSANADNGSVFCSMDGASLYYYTEKKKHIENIGNFG